MNHGFVETVVGILVVAVAATFLFVGYCTTSKKPVNAATYKASFESIEGVIASSDVKLGGVQIGVVSDISFDDEFQVVVTMKLNKTVKFPKDSTAAISTSGLIGDKFIEIIPGGDCEYLKDGDTFAFTKSSTNLESFVNKIIASFVNKPKK
jgi:phospholipid/cholesterol/gamma-HCH transport system substrate-binding protein